MICVIIIILIIIIIIIINDHVEEKQQQDIKCLPSPVFTPFRPTSLCPHHIYVHPFHLMSVFLPPCYTDLTKKPILVTYLFYSIS